MIAIASARHWTVKIGADQQDWSAHRVAFDVGFEQRDSSGLFLVTGQLELMPLEVNPESLNPRDNRARWHRGQVIEITCADQSGILVPHRHGRLYLLKAPQPPSSTNRNLTLELGCILALQSFAQADNDASGVRLGTSASRTDIINALLTRAGCPRLIDPITEFPLNYPLPKQGGSWVEQAGQIAYSAGFGLYQDRLGQIRARSLRTPPLQAPLLEITEGQDEIDGGYEPLSGSEIPVEKAIAAGVRTELADNTQSTTFYSEVGGPANAINSAYSGWVIQRVSRGTEAIDETGRKSQEVVEEAAGLVYPFSRAGQLGLTFSSRSTSSELYAEGLLKAQRTATTRPLEAIAGSWIESLSAQERTIAAGFEASSETLTEYYYDGAKRVRKIVETSYTVAAAIAGSRNPIAFQDCLSKVAESQTIREWFEFGPGWKYRETRKRGVAFTQRIENPGETITQTFFSLQIEEEKTQASTQGNAPPASEGPPGRYTQTEKPISGSASFALGGNTESQRERVWSVDYANTSEQLREIAEWEGALLVGRNQGQIIQIPLLDDLLFSDDPLPTLRVIERDGTEVWYQADTVKITHDQTRAIAGATGVWLGSRSAAAIAAGLPPQRPWTLIRQAAGGHSEGGQLRLLFGGGFQLSQIEAGEVEGGSAALLSPRELAIPVIEASGGSSEGGSAVLLGTILAYNNAPATSISYSVSAQVSGWIPSQSNMTDAPISTGGVAGNPSSGVVWFMADLGTSQRVSTVFLNRLDLSPYSVSNAFTNARIESSNDGTTWTFHRNASFGSGQPVSIRAAARYIRVVRLPGNTQVLSIGTFQIFT